MQRIVVATAALALALVEGCSGGSGAGSAASTAAAPLTTAPTAAWSVAYVADGAASTSAVAAALGPDGDLVVLGQAPSGGAVVKLDGAGRVVWQAPWTADAGTQETVRRLGVSGAGSIVAGASFTADDGTSGAVVRKWDANGTPMWTARWTDGPLGDVAIQDDGDVVVTTAGATHCVDGADAPRWDAPTPGALVRFDSVGDVLVAGTSNDGEADKTTVTFFDTQGALAWSYRADDGVSRGLVAGSAPRAMTVDAAGNVYVAGYRRSKTDPREPVYAYETQTLALDVGGGVLFARSDAVLQDGSMGAAIAVDPATGRVTVTGVTASPNAPGYQQYMTFQFEADGTPRWSSLDTWDGAPGHKRPAAVAAAAGGVVLVSRTIDAGDEAATVAYDDAGAVAFRIRGAGTGVALAIDGSGGFYVVGTGAGAVRVTRYVPGP